MRLRAVLFIVLACAAVGAGAQRLAERATLHVERTTARAVAEGLAAAGESWARAATDGLVVTLAGAAPDEASRVRAVEILRRTVDPRRVRDATSLANRDPAAPPAFALELLRNGTEVTLIGLVPATSGQATIEAALRRSGLDKGLDNLIESADHAAPAGWDAALGFGLEAVVGLPRAKVSVTPGRVAVAALAGDEATRRTLEANLRAARPDGVALELAIKAPRQVIAPFGLAFTVDGDGPRFSECAVDGPEDAAAIAAAAGLPTIDCAIGPGSPSPDWVAAASAGVAAVRELGGGTFALSDIGANLTAPAGTPLDRLQTVGAVLDEELPAIFSLSVETDGPAPSERRATPTPTPRFTATLRADGALRLAGTTQDAVSRDAVGSYAAALFGHAAVTNAAVVAAGSPEGWSGRVLAGIDALALLNEGELAVSAASVTLRGWSASADGAARAKAIFAARGVRPAEVALNFDAAAARAEAEANAIDADPVAACAAAVASTGSAGAIAFEPGSARLADSGARVIAAIAGVMADCPPLDFEIAGHTDSQGGAEGNLRLSEERATTVKAALDATGLPHMRFFARGYGADRPVADNATEDGRARNRRIEFTLIADTTRAPVIPPITGPEAPFGPR